MSEATGSRAAAGVLFERGRAEYYENQENFYPQRLAGLRIASNPKKLERTIF